MTLSIASKQRSRNHTKPQIHPALTWPGHDWKLSMTQYLHDFFAGHTERAIDGMKAALQAESFYKRLQARLAKGEDLSGEVPIIAKVGAQGALEVVEQAIQENQALVQTVWELPPKIKKLGKQQLDMQKEPFEHLPRVALTYNYKSPAGAVVVSIRTAGENFKIEMTSSPNKMAAELSLRELEKEISFALLSA